MKSVVITGVYGSGKTEFCLQYALKWQKELNQTVYLADLDILNPYFRSREQDAFLKDHDIIVEGNCLGNNPGADIPAISYGFVSKLRSGLPVIMDLAGSERGLSVLAGIKEDLVDCEVWCVINLNRPDSARLEQIRDFVANVRSYSGLSVTGIVNNTHMLGFTTEEDILRGEEAANSVGLPVIYSVVPKRLMPMTLKTPVLEIDELLMRKSWQ